MKILIINEVCGVTSTGTICADLAEYLLGKGHEVKVLYGRLDAPDRCASYSERIAPHKEIVMNALSARVFDNCGRGNRAAAKRAVSVIRDFKPDVVHLHNLHGYYINYPELFRVLAELKIPVVWTLHDMWALTGHCAYFDSCGCDKWKTGCGKCPQKKGYPKSILLDRSAVNYREKKKAYELLPDMKVVVPSRWLAGFVKESILKREALVIPNGVDTSVFKPGKKDYFKEKGLTDKKVVLGVASLWEPRKGIGYFIELAEKLSDEYRIVLVGVNDQQKSELPENIITIARTNDRKELAEIYSGSYVYLNPTLEDNYPTTNLEAICCGTPVITFRTGGSPESAELFGTVCEKNVDSILEAIDKASEISTDKLDELRFAMDADRMKESYEALYKELI